MRLDVFLAERGYAGSRTRARSLIEAGDVTVNGKRVTKCSYAVDESAEIEIAETNPYVSRGALKLEGAIGHFGIDVRGMVALDIGASSGGFTDCLLRHGAAHVYAVDSGSDQMAPSLRADGRVTVIEHYNARYMKRGDFSVDFDIAVMDVSFISQTLIIPALSEVLAGGALFVSLVKPQFEVGRELVGKGGIVKDERARLSAIERVRLSAEQHYFIYEGSMRSPIDGGDGNIEYLSFFRKRKE